MARYTTSPIAVDAVQFDGTFASVASFLGGSATFTVSTPTSFLETNRGRVQVNPTDWLVRNPATTADLFDDSDDFYLSVLPNAAFVQNYTAA